MLKRIGALAALILVSGAARGADEADFTSQCVAALKKQGRPGILVGGVCECIADKTADRPDLREEFLSLMPLTQEERETQISKELRAVRSQCVPFAPT